MIVIIPAHNEEKTIAELIGRIRALYEAAMITVIDDGSTDNTWLAARRTEQCVVKRNHRQAEYGDGFIMGMEYAVANRFDPIVFIDAGLSHNPQDIPLLVAALERSDVAIGSRIATGAVYEQKRWRKALTWMSIRALAFAYGGEMTDYSGFRAFRLGAALRLLESPALEQIPCRQAHAFNLYLLALMKGLDFKMVQVPIHYTGTNSTLNAKRCLEAVVAWLHLVRRAWE